MPTLQDAIRPILSLPTPEALIALQGALLTCGREGEAVDNALKIAGHFCDYLGELQSKIAAREYSEMASKLDIGAVGAVALENLISAEKDDFWEKLVLGGLAEGLMVAASRQYIKGWEVETGLVHSHAAWVLTEALWHASNEMQPDFPSEQRWQVIQALLAPAYDRDVPAPEKALLLGRIFQILLITYLAQFLPGPQS